MSSDLTFILEDGALPKRTTIKIAEGLSHKKTLNNPLEVLHILRRGIPHEFLRAAAHAHASQALPPSEVILSSFLVKHHI